MNNFERKSLAVFNDCVNRTFRVSTPGRSEVVCPQYPEGGVGFDSSRINKGDDGQNTARGGLAKRLGCAACPYPNESITVVSIERTDAGGNKFRETRFEPVAPEAQPSQS